MGIDVHQSHVDGYLSKLILAMNKLNRKEIVELYKLLKETTEKDARVFIAGNGGSATTSEHFVTDLGIGSHIRGAKLTVKAFSLNSNVGVLTALSNDTAYEKVFSEQLKSLEPKKTDIVIAISASGNSPNILNLLLAAKSLGMRTCALTGFDGGKARELADLSVHVSTDLNEYGIVEDLHLSICHIVTELLRK
jgi:D-sedoheptulose 7-phosphate isomerase